MEVRNLQPSVRAVTLSSYPEVASHVGLDAYDMLRRARITPEMLSEAENRIPAQAVCKLLEDSARESGFATFGLAMAGCRSFASLGPLSLLLEHLGSAGEVIAALTEYRRHLNDVIILGIEEANGEEIVRVELLANFATTQAVDLALGVAFVALRGASRFRWQPLEIHLSRSAPDDRGPYDRLFAVPVQFDSAFNGFTCGSRSMESHWPWANETMAQNVRRLLGLVQLAQETAPLSQSVARIISLCLPSGRATLPHVAAQLGKSPRTLQRGLAQEGRQFAGLLNEVRRSLVVHHLCNGKSSMTAIAAMLGFFTSSSFSRWFVMEFGVPPRIWRAEEMRAAATNLI